MGEIRSFIKVSYSVSVHLQFHLVCLYLLEDPRPESSKTHPGRLDRGSFSNTIVTRKKKRQKKLLGARLRLNRDHESFNTRAAVGICLCVCVCVCGPMGISFNISLVSALHTVYIELRKYIYVFKCLLIIHCFLPVYDDAMCDRGTRRCSFHVQRRARGSSCPSSVCVNVSLPHFLLIHHICGVRKQTEWQQIVTLTHSLTHTHTLYWGR